MSKSISREAPSRRRHGAAAVRRGSGTAPPALRALGATERGAVRTPRAAQAGVRLRASIVVADLRGFTKLAAEREPERVVALLNDFFSAMTDVAVAHRAMIDKVIGDAILLLYGMPAPRRDDAVRAVRTAVAMQRAFLALRNRWLAAGEQGAAQLGLGVGIASGDVLVANVRPSGWIDYTAIGEPVNAAAQLCGAARAAENLIDETTYAAVGTRLDDELLFTSRELGLKSHRAMAAYRVQPRRPRLHVVPRLPVCDPVCGSAVEPQRAVQRFAAGQTYYFCSLTCARRFLADPASFAG